MNSAVKDKRFLRYADMKAAYSIGRNMARDLVKAAGAEIRIGGIVLIDPEKLDAYIRSQSN